jgi:hypothetical protein
MSLLAVWLILTVFIAPISIVVGIYEWLKYRNYPSSNWKEPFVVGGLTFVLCQAVFWASVGLILLLIWIAETF